MGWGLGLRGVLTPTWSPITFPKRWESVSQDLGLGSPSSYSLCGGAEGLTLSGSRAQASQVQALSFRGRWPCTPPPSIIRPSLLPVAVPAAIQIE